MDDRHMSVAELSRRSNIGLQAQIDMMARRRDGMLFEANERKVSVVWTGALYHVFENGGDEPISSGTTLIQALRRAFRSNTNTPQG
jgi:hypothetical protein